MEVQNYYFILKSRRVSQFHVTERPIGGASLDASRCSGDRRDTGTRENRPVCVLLGLWAALNGIILILRFALKRTA